MSNWTDFLLAKLREFENIWLIAYKDARLRGIHTDKLQSHALQLCGQLLLLLANRPLTTPNELIESVSGLCEQLQRLGETRFFMDGGTSVKAFNDQGDQILEQVKNAVELIEKVAQLGDVAFAFHLRD